MKAALSDGSDSSETLAEANEYAAAKVDYYRAARQAMPDLLQMTKTLAVWRVFEHQSGPGGPTNSSARDNSR